MKLTAKPQAAIFDMDGLMLDTERSVIIRISEKAREYGLNAPFEVLVKTVGINYRASDVIVRAELGDDFPYLRLREEIIPDEKADFEAHGIAQKPGLIPLLDALREKNIPIAVATSTDRERTLWKLKCGGLAARFELMVCGDEVQHGKPAPDIFLRAAQLMGMPPEVCVGFEDSPAGLRALAAAGIRSVFVKDIIEPDAAILATVWKRCADLSEAIPLF